MVDSLERPAFPIRVVLFADVLADLLQFQPDRGDSIATSPEMLAREIPLLAAQRAIAIAFFRLRNPITEATGCLGGMAMHMCNMVWHQAPFHLALVLPSQRVENLPQMTAPLPEDGFAPPLLAVVLALVGIYDIMSYLVTQRRHEVGVRLALGAQQGDVMRLMLWHGIKLAAVGAAAGLVVSWSMQRVIAGFLWGVTPTDPSTFAGAGFLLMAVTLLASYIPARRAATVDPMIALRHE